MFSAKAWVRIPRRFHRISLAVAGGAAGFLLLGTPRLICQGAQGQKLQQGTDVIKEILAKDGLYTRTTKSGDQYKSVMERKFELTSAKGCQMVVTSDTHIHTEMPSQNRVSDRNSTEFFYPDFSVFNPASVIVSDPQPAQPTWEMKGYLVRITVEIGKPPMKASSRIQQTNEEHDLPPLPGLSVYVKSREQADRLAKAFAQVATACRANSAQ
jgi:hypothetical protein